MLGLVGVALLVGATFVGVSGSSQASSTPVQDPSASPQVLGTTVTRSVTFGDIDLDSWLSPVPPVSTEGAGAPAEFEPLKVTPNGSVSVAGKPVAARIRSVDIAVELDPLGLDDDGALEVPEDFDRGGWFSGGPKPGEVGPAVIAAHVDSTDGPAPFFRLKEVAVGDSIDVLFSEGDTVTFIATRIEQHPKDEFPTLDVYGNTDEAELRMITCGGDFDRRERSYRNNIIVWATRA